MGTLKINPTLRDIMLLVKADKVNYCQVVRRNGVESEIIPGLVYLNKLYVRGKSYPKDRRNEANDNIRRFIDSQDKIACLVVESDEKLTIFYADNRALFAFEGDGNTVADRDPISQIDLQHVISEMRGIGGIKIKDRRYHLRVYPQCFLGSDAVDWMRDRFRISREEAVRLGQRLMDAKHIHHVVDDHKFKDDNLFYRFYWDENN